LDYYSYCLRATLVALAARKKAPAQYQLQLSKPLQMQKETLKMLAAQAATASKPKTWSA
jgi:hypothetical protein